MKHPVQYLVFVLLFIALTQSCRKQDDDFSNIAIQGEVESWIYGDNRKVELCAYSDTSSMLFGPYTSFGSSTIDGNGKFKIGYLNAPTNDFLVPLESIFGNNIALSNTTAKGLKGILLVYNKNSGVLVGDMIYGNTGFYINPGISFYESYIYVDKNVDITGNGIHSYQDSFSTYIDTFNCNLGLKFGWNKFTQKVISLNSYFSRTYEVSNLQPMEANWYYQDFN